MVRLTTVGDPIEARIIAARLGSEGVLWELRGGIDGPYPMGPFHVYVAEPDLATPGREPAERHPPDRPLQQHRRGVERDHCPEGTGATPTGRAGRTLAPPCPAADRAMPGRRRSWRRSRSSLAARRASGRPSPPARR